MLCQNCGRNESTTHIKTNVNGKREEMHLCSECARELGVMDEFKIPSVADMFGDSFLGNFLGAGAAAMNSLVGVERCHSCGSSFNDIVKSGRIGCADCYDMFSDKLEPSIRKIHGRAKHIGKYVSYTNDEEREHEPKEKQPSELDSLKLELEKAIAEQRFEDAAVIRDKINEIQGDNNE